MGIHVIDTDGEEADLSRKDREEIAYALLKAVNAAQENPMPDEQIEATHNFIIGRFGGTSDVHKAIFMLLVYGLATVNNETGELSLTDKVPEWFAEAAAHKALMDAGEGQYGHA